jgi:hypothetical protein
VDNTSKDGTHLKEKALHMAAQLEIDNFPVLVGLNSLLNIVRKQRTVSFMLPFSVL